MKLLYNREQLIDQLKQTSSWDIIVVGGGSTGLGVALDAATRGYKTLLFEGVDFAKGTSSRSTKLLHGGVRYLAQGNINLVKEALLERDLLLKNAPHTLGMLTADDWNLPYSRQRAAYPLAFVMDNKFWPSVRRLDEAFGDRNLICSCTSIKDYAKA